MSAYDIQKLLDSPGSDGVVRLPAGEYEGRFIIKKSCTVDGGGASLWNSYGPVLVVAAEKVTIKNIRIELSADEDSIPYKQYVSVYCRYPDTKFSDTEINGMLLGIPHEEQYWGLPKTVSLGRLPAEREQSFTLELYAPAAAEISCGLHDIRLSADSLCEGFNTVTLTVGRVRSGSLIYGYITVRSAVTRKIIVSGEIGDENDPAPLKYMLCSADREAPMRHSEMLERLDPVQLASAPEPAREEVEIPYEAIDEGGGASEGFEEENITVPSGKRILLSMRQYRIELLHGFSAAELDVDGYMFMLDKTGFVSTNKHMIFFGNDHSECGGVRYLNAADKRAFFVDFRLIPKDVTRMVLLFSIYGNDPSKLFDKLADGEISVLCENGVHIRMKLERGINCRTILALGFEKTDGVWEMITSGKGVGMPLEEICRSYGVTIIS